MMEDLFLKESSSNKRITILNFIIGRLSVISHELFYFFANDITRTYIVELPPKYNIGTLKISSFIENALTLHYYCTIYIYIFCWG